MVDEALNELAQMGEAETAPDAPKSMQLFNAAVSGGDSTAPKFKELVQYSLDPDLARFVLILEDGREVNVGPYSNLRQPRRLDERIGPTVHYVMQTVRDNDVWRDAISTMLKIVIVREEEEVRVTEWVRKYTEDRLGAKKEAAVPEGEPFTEDGFVLVQPASLALYVKQRLSESIKRQDLPPLLKEAGFEQKTVHYTNRSGKESTKSYWRISAEEL